MSTQLLPVYETQFGNMPAIGHGSASVRSHSMAAGAWHVQLSIFCGPMCLTNEMTADSARSLARELIAAADHYDAAVAAAQVPA